jgi:hypothetical protein
MNKKIQKINDFILISISDFREKSKIINKHDDFFKPKFDPDRFYSSGHCAEFAFNLAKFAADCGLKPKIIIMYRNEIDIDSKISIDKTFSHCVVDINGESFDVSGNDAMRRWFNRMDFNAYSENKKTENEWEFVKIPFNNGKKAMLTLMEHCEQHLVDLGEVQIEKDAAIFAGFKKLEIIKDQEYSF